MSPKTKAAVDWQAVMQGGLFYLEPAIANAARETRSLAEGSHCTGEQAIRVLLTFGKLQRQLATTVFHLAKIAIQQGETFERVGDATRRSRQAAHVWLSDRKLF